MKQEKVWFRQGRSQARNVYRHMGDEADGTYIGVFFDPQDARMAVAALNALCVANGDGDDDA